MHLPISIKPRFILATHNPTEDSDNGEPLSAFRLMFKAAIERKPKDLLANVHWPRICCGAKDLLHFRLPKPRAVMFPKEKVRNGAAAMVHPGP
jgi:hypothetical protein